VFRGWINLPDTPHRPPPLPAGRKPGTVGSRRIGRVVLQRYLDEGLAFAERSILSLLM
jgi:hypothetical protein